MFLGRRLSDADLGFFALATSALALVHLLLDLGTGSLAVSHGARSPGEEARVLQGLLRFRRRLALPAGIAFAGWAVAESDSSRRVALAGMALLMGVLPGGVLAAGLQIRRRFLAPALLSVACQGAMLLALLGTPLRWLSGGVAAAMLVAREAVQTAALQWLARRAGVPAGGGDAGRLPSAFLAAAVPMGAVTLCQALYFHADVWMIRALRGESELGAFAAGMRPLQPLAFLPGVFFLPLLPRWAGLLRRGASGPVRRLALRATRSAVLAAVPAAALLALLAGPAIEALYGGMYLAGEGDARGVFRLGAFAYAGIFAGAAAHTALLAMGATRALLLTASAGLAFNAAANLLLIPRWGYVAAAATTLATEWGASLLAATLCFGRAGLFREGSDRR